jgi:hypothetical protein
MIIEGDRIWNDYWIVDVCLSPLASYGPTRKFKLRHYRRFTAVSKTCRQWRASGRCRKTLFELKLFI